MTQRPLSRLFLYFGLPIAIVGSSAMIARAFDTSWITSGETISAGKLKADLDEVQSRLAALENRLPPDPGVANATINQQGNVTDRERIERIKFAGDPNGTQPCTVASLSNCVIVSQSGNWVSKVVHVGPGDYHVVFAANAFNAAPTCTCIADGNPAAAFCSGRPTATEFDFDVTTNSGTLQDDIVDVVCMGSF